MTALSSLVFGAAGIAAALGVDRLLTRRGSLSPAGSPAAPAEGVVGVHPAVTVALTGVLWAALALRFGPGTTLPAEAVMVTGVVPLAASDLERYLLPKRLVYPALAGTAAAVLGAAAANGDWSRLGVAAACGLGSWVVFLVLHLARPGWLGFGDVRLAALLGLGIGWVDPRGLLPAFLVANLAAAIVGIGLIATGRATRRTPLPYGVFLSLGALAAVLAPVGLLRAVG